MNGDGNGPARVALVLGLVFLSTAAPAQSVYKWTDASGETHYSSSPPKGADAQALDLPAQPPEAQQEAARERLNSRNEAFAERREARAEAEQEAAEQERRAEKRAANCERARGNLAALTAASRRLTLDEQGNAVRLTEAQRQQRMHRAREAIEKYCGD